MKKIVLSIVMFVLALTINAQNDTMYIMKNGVIADKYNIKNQVDSVIFYKPTSTGSSTTVTDFDGNVYNTVTIGRQVWMKENLKTTHYANGTAIPLVYTKSTWNDLSSTSKAYCWYNDNIVNKDTYGALYTWAAAMNGAAGVTTNPSRIQGVCPTGWHLPSDDEWTQMENYLADNGFIYDGTTGGERDKIAKAMAASIGWKRSSNTGSVGNTDYSTFRNKSGFTALPGGYRYSDGSFYYIGYFGTWWSATEGSATNAWDRNIGNDGCNVGRGTYDNEVGKSVRCVRD